SLIMKPAVYHRRRMRLRGLLTSRTSISQSVGFLRAAPDQWWVGWGDSHRTATPPERLPAFYLPDFFLKDENPWVCFENHSCFSTIEFSELLQPGSAPQWNWK